MRFLSKVELFCITAMVLTVPLAFGQDWLRRQISRLRRMRRPCTNTRNGKGRTAAARILAMAAGAGDPPP